ncbi:MAG TPA: HAD family hydrolase [Sphingobacteriaceae bacterium]
MLTLIFDLDNTIYPVSSIRDRLFPPLFRLLARPEFSLEEQTIKSAKKELMRRPFQKVAEEFKFPGELVKESLNLLRKLTIDEPMACFEDYHIARMIPAQRFLVTSGFYRLQQSKIKELQIGNDFREVFIIDPDTSPLSKKDIFARILEKYELDVSGVVIVGDDPESEIRAASELGIRSFLLDPDDQYPDCECSYRARRLGELAGFLKNEGLLRNEPNEIS